MPPVQHSRTDQRQATEQAPALGTLWLRALRLRCPACGRASIFRGWFTMNDACAACGRKFERGAGYLLGSIYFNYGVTAMLVLVLYFAMFFGDVLTNGQRLAALSAFGVLFRHGSSATPARCGSRSMSIGTLGPMKKRRGGWPTNGRS